MKNVLLYLSNAYYTTLNGNLTLGSAVLPVYDGMAPSTETGSYVLLSVDRNAQQTGNKCTYQWTAQMLVDVVIKNGNFGFIDSDTVAEQVCELINTFNHLPVSNFQTVNTSVSSINNLQGLNQTEPVFRTLIRYQHNIFQNN
jgi:hypothetical protein